MSESQNVGTVQCEICGSSSIPSGQGWSQRRRNCPRCGTFEYDGLEWWTHLRSESHRVRLSGWIREQNDAGVPFVKITRDVYIRTENMALPSLQERANRVLLTFARKWPDIEGLSLLINVERDPEILGRSYCSTSNELRILIGILTESGFLRAPPPSNTTVGISIKGILEVESLGAKTVNSSQGFVAMSFDPAMNDSWSNGFDPGIRAAGYAPFRIDRKDFLGGISDEIISEIRRSRFLVVDYTKQNNGAYFEAGFALGLGLPIIPTCHNDEVSKLHFDIKHLNTLLWEAPTDLSEKLTRRISAVIPF
jgi:hypothetical protein